MAVIILPIGAWPANPPGGKILPRYCIFISCWSKGALVAKLGSTRGNGVRPGSNGEGGPNPISNCLIGGTIGGLLTGIGKGGGGNATCVDVGIPI